MPIRRIAISAAFAAGLATLPLSTAEAQYYPPCPPFTLFWPFCVAGAVVGTAAIIVTAPPFGYYPPPPYYYPPPPQPGYYAPAPPTGYYGPR